MSRIYYPVRYLLDNTTRYFLWYSDDAGDEADGVVVDQDKSVLVFQTPIALAEYAHAHELLPLAEEDGLHNFDVIRKSLKRKRPGQIDCNAFLTGWNMFGDISASVGGGFDPDRAQTQKIYRKLFWGSNLPAVTPPGKHFEPRWSRADIRLMRQILGEGLTMFCCHISLLAKHLVGE